MKLQKSTGKYRVRQEINHTQSQQEGRNKIILTHNKEIRTTQNNQMLNKMSKDSNRLYTAYFKNLAYKNQYLNISTQESFLRSHFSRARLFASLWMVACQAPLSMGFSRQEYWNRLLFPPPGHLPNPEIETRSPALQADSLP